MLVFEFIFNYFKLLINFGSYDTYYYTQLHEFEISYISYNGFLVFNYKKDLLHSSKEPL